MSIPEAAQVLGLSSITIRRRIKRGELRGQRLKTPQGFEWRVILPADVIDAASGGEDQASTPSPQAGAQSSGTPGVAGGDQRLITALEAHNTSLQAEISGLRTELDARRREVQALITLLAQSQQRLLEAPPPAPAEDEPDEEAGDQGSEQPLSTREEYAASEQSSSSDQPIRWWSRVVGWLRGT